MCSGSKRKLCSADLAMEPLSPSCSDLLEFSASDDLSGFKVAVEEHGRSVDESGIWYGRKLGLKKMGFEERTPIMIASMFGSKRVLNYILEKGVVDVNRACGSDGATALHCAVAGGSAASHEVVKLLLDASADVNLVDANGRRPADLIASVGNSCFNSRRKMLQLLLNGDSNHLEGSELNDQLMEQAENQQVLTPVASREGTEKKEYPVDPSLPDIKNGIYGTDEFRMYTFKVKPCSRAYSHDWTECPFVHPGENARRRDPRKYHYSCVPCPDFRKGSCQRGDTCEYAHGIFECWLHPAQYRTRLCKDETNCARRVCFFAHKPEELRPLYASTGSAVPSPRSLSSGASAFDLASVSPLNLGSPSAMMPPTSTPPMTPSGASSPIGGSIWANQSTLIPPTLQLPGSRLKSSINARDIDFDVDLSGLDHLRQQQFFDDLNTISSPSSWSNGLGTSVDRNVEAIRHAGLTPTNLDDIFGNNIDSTILSQLQGLKVDARSSQLLSPNAIQLRHNMNQQLRQSYSNSLSPSPVRTSSSSFGIDSSGSAAAVLSPRAAAFAKRSQSFIDRGPVNRLSGISSPISPAAAGGMHPSNLSDWSSPDGKLDWGIQKEEINKLRKSASFGFRNNGNNLGTAAGATSVPRTINEPDTTWVPSARPSEVDFDEHHQQQHYLNGGGQEMLPLWVDQLCMEQEQIVA
ncbi:hypothetical protein M9H77_05937 [Catharanthus roseus]|uniref:Uncharacterized protein n=1 Tax=Catharanthus roseus TaxID=4058 RepID=A0ACC0BQX1_CATRO|nr:hypothetical protein M9H77_05937 [Catharanthus roseus]